MLARNWKHRWFPLCFARRARTVSMDRPVAKPMRSYLFSLHHECESTWLQVARDLSRNVFCKERFSFLQPGRIHDPGTLALRASQRFVYRKLTGRVIICHWVLWTRRVTGAFEAFVVSAFAVTDRFGRCSHFPESEIYPNFITACVNPVHTSRVCTQEESSHVSRDFMGPCRDGCCKQNSTSLCVDTVLHRATYENFLSYIHFPFRAFSKCEACDLSR